MTTLRYSLAVYALFMMVFLVGPILAILPISFSSAGFLSYPIPGFSLRWYERVFMPTPWMAALRNSIVIGVGATILATVLGTLAALGLTRQNLPATSLILGLMISPIIVPVVITGVGIYFLFVQLGLIASFSGLILAHTVLGAPFVVVTVAATLQNFDRNLVRAAYSLGASPVRTFFDVTLPLIAPGVIAGAIFAFVVSLDEVVIVIFVGGPEQRTLPRQMFDGIRDNIDPSILAMSVILILVTIVFMAAFAFLSRQEPQNGRHQHSKV